MSVSIPPAVLDRIKAAAGADAWSEEPERLAPHLVEWRGRWSGWTPLLLLPRTVEAVARIVRVCAETGAPLMPQGGNTGLVAGQIPQGEVLLSLERMSAIRALSTEDDVLIVEAGATLAAVRSAAEDADRLFPLSLASEGSCTVGGLIATNAGGVAVLRYGQMRALTLGIEAVLPDGSIHHGLKRLRKDNTGYDLKQLLIGAEGTLGVVTAASLKLFPRLADRAVALASVPDPAAAVALLTLARGASGGAVEAFELLNAEGLALALKNLPGARSPFAAVPPWTVLIEIAGAASGEERSRRLMETVLGSAMEAGLADDAAIAQNAAQAAAFWALREGQSAAQKAEGSAWKHDVATPVSRIATFIEQASRGLQTLRPGVRILAFGHIGDGNIHFDALKPPGTSDAAHDQLRDAAARIVHDVAMGLEGTISAEHGLGSVKVKEALRFKDPVDVAAMRAVRAALDPARIMNPRVLF